MKAWEQIQFDPFIKDGWLVGRGAADMKGGAGWSAICHSTFTRKLGIELPGDLIFNQVIGEEVG